MQYAEQKTAIFKETSAKRDKNIEELFIEIGNCLNLTRSKRNCMFF